MFKVIVKGTYVARSPLADKEKIKKNYEIEGIIPTTKAALSIVKNKLLSPALSAKYPDYVTYLTYNIVSIVPLDDASKVELEKTEIEFMDRPALVQFIRDNALAVLQRYYPDLYKLREAVRYAKDDPAGYQKHFDIHKADLDLDLQMAAANPSLFPKDPGHKPLAASVVLEPRQARQVAEQAQQMVDVAKKALSEPIHAQQEANRLDGLKADMARNNEIGPMDEIDNHKKVTEPESERTVDDL